MRRIVTLLVLSAATLLACNAAAQETQNAAPPPRHITLSEAVQLALKHNHDIRIADYAIEEKEHAKRADKSQYFPSIRNDSMFAHATDTELIQMFIEFTTL